MSKSAPISAPPMAALLRHLADAPLDWLATPELVRSPGVRVSALLADCLDALAATPLSDAEAAPFEGSDKSSLGRLRLTLLSVWVLHQAELQSALRDRMNAPRRAALLAFLNDDLARRAAHLSAERVVDSSEGREELVRQLLSGLDLLPADESATAFAYRLKARDSIEQAQLVAAARSAEERARKLREAMARKAAEEAAMKYNRE
jgi:hypothetical protein